CHYSQSRKRKICSNHRLCWRIPYPRQGGGVDEEILKIVPNFVELKTLNGKLMSSSAHELRRTSVQPSLWTLPEIAGRLVEISSSGASASLTIVFGLVREAQKRREPVGWVTSMESVFYPLDAVHGGIDLAALAVIRVLHT